MTTRTWKIDPSHSGIHFTVRHMVFSKVRGSFDSWDGSIELDEKDPSASKVSVRIDAASIDTREAKRDEHLRSADFFDVKTYPELTFESASVEKRSDDRYAVIGDLTIHGTTRRVELDTELLGTGADPWGNQRIAFQARTSVLRKDFGLGWNQVLETGGLLVGDQIEITLDVQAVLAQAVEKVA
ncbi:MAG TPA: YceI family protein [Kofleriaceae bacterium]|nr:YceI family protein [Kofleriaceae bacterium]